MLLNWKRRASALLTCPSGKAATAMLLLATIIGQSLQFLGMIWLSRLYSPADFGIFAAFLAINTWLMPLCCLRYEWAIPIAPTDAEAHDLHALAMSLAIVNGFTLSVLVYLFAALFRHDTLGGGGVQSWMMCISLIFIGLSEANRLWLVRTSAYSVLIRLRVVALTAPIACQILLGVAIGGINGLLIGYTLGHGINMAFSAVQCRSQMLATLASLRLSRLFQAGKNNRRFALFTCPAAMVSGATMQMPSIILPSLFSAATAGSYALAQRVVLSPVYLINYAVRTVFWADAAKDLRSSPEKLRERFFKTSAALSLILVPTIIVAPLGPDIFAWCFGEVWRTAGLYASVLMIPAASFVISRSTSCLDILGHNKVQLLIDSVQFIATLAIFAFAWWLPLAPLTTVCAFAVTAVTAHATVWLRNALLLTRTFKGNMVMPVSEPVGG